jgi:hypothetical protein
MIRKLAKNLIDSCIDISKDNGDNFATTYLDIHLTDKEYENFCEYEKLQKEIESYKVVDSCEVFSSGRIDIVFKY